MISSMWVQLLISVVLGGAIGWERYTDRKPAGLRTHALVCLGAAGFMIAAGGASADATRVMQGVVTGIGFLGAGSIIQSAGSVHGLTSAATIWLVAAIGAAVGAGDAALGAGLTVLGLIVLRGFRVLENEWRRRHPRHPRGGATAAPPAPGATPQPGPGAGPA